MHSGKDFLVSARTTGCEPTVEEAIAIAEEYIKAGCDYLQVSSGIDMLDDLPDYPDSKVSRDVGCGDRTSRTHQFPPMVDSDGECEMVCPTLSAQGHR